MVWKHTQKTEYIRLPEQRLKEIEELVAAWPYQTKDFMRARLNQYSPPSSFMSRTKDILLSIFLVSNKKSGFKIINDPEILTDWQKRFEISGQLKPLAAWNKILQKEVSSKDYVYLLSLLNSELADIHVPYELSNLFEKIFRAYIRKEYITDSDIPKAPLILLIGPSGSGKTATATQAIEKVFFASEVQPEVDLIQKKEELLADQPFWKTIEEVNPDLAMEMIRGKRLKFYKFLSRIPLVSLLLKKRLSRHLSALEDQGIAIDFSIITPNDYQTARAGEPGNFLKKAFGDPKRTSIRHLEEAHSAFGKSTDRESGIESQQQTLIDTSNIILDEITSGRRDCLLIATTDQPERFNPTVYRRFVEKGVVIDVSEYWQNEDNLAEIVRLELLHSNIRTFSEEDANLCKELGNCVELDDIKDVVNQLYIIFRERALKISPSYVRKLVSSIIELKGDFSKEHFENPLLVRKAFELVAQNAFGDLFSKVVKRMDRDAQWEDYVGNIKYTFSEMINNCLFYDVSSEKGVVLNGPPGGGKTFLVRSWLSENHNINDISASPNLLQNPANPYDGAVDNLEKIYDIAKMIAPTVVFFDEGDSLAPRRSSTGTSPSDKLTNKFLSIIDGEIPLFKVFTVLTTNRLDLLDPALVRSKRLKVLEISGHLKRKDISEIVVHSLKDIPLQDQMDIDSVLKSAEGICDTPADYAAFIEKACSLRSTEHQVLMKFRKIAEVPEDDQKNFIKFNYKSLNGILEAVKAPRTIRSKTSDDPMQFLSQYDEIVGLFDGLDSPEYYCLSFSHLKAARKEISQSPVKKGAVQLDEFLEAELSQEPQVGFIIGVGANDVSGVLLPIATSLTYKLSEQKVLVTGAVSPSGPESSQLDMAVQMTQQSAQEAFTLIKNYLQGLTPKVSLARIFGEFLEHFVIHHQLLSASYNVGGPSAGYALAINTLSAILQLPVCNDFGITGAPWTKGVKKGEVGGSVIIGGHKKKSEKVLQHLKRMFMPLQNYKSLEPEFLINYWTQHKDILGVTHFGDLVPEVLWLGNEIYDNKVKSLINNRIEYKINKYKGNKSSTSLKETILLEKEELRRQVETEIIKRIKAIHNYVKDPDRDPHLSHEEIFKLNGNGSDLFKNSFSTMIKKYPFLKKIRGKFGE